MCSRKSSAHNRFHRISTSKLSTVIRLPLKFQVEFTRSENPNTDNLRFIIFLCILSLWNHSTSLESNVIRVYRVFSSFYYILDMLLLLHQSIRPIKETLDYNQITEITFCVRVNSHARIRHLDILSLTV